MRKEFTVSERVAIAQAVAEKMPNRHGGDRKSDQAGNISGLIEKGETKDIAAAKAGLGSGKTYEAAKKVVMEGAPELVKAMDEGAHLKWHPLKQGVSPAHHAMVWPRRIAWRSLI
jgi:ParB family chromosome partitioning protein